CLDACELRMDAARHHAANAWNQLRLPAHGDDAGRGADHVDDISLTAPRANRVPVRVECSDGHWNASPQAKLLGPLRSEMPSQVIRGEIVARESFANAVKESVKSGEKRLRRQAVPLGIPHPFVAHGADAAFGQPGIGDAAE